MIWHPDKNQDRDTTEKFQMITEAYECLSNEQERAWYDQHRDQILKGKEVGQSEASEDTASYITKSKLAKFMEKGAFSGYTKQPTDFYTVFHNLFAKMDQEEEMEEEVGVVHKQAPQFGDAQSSKDHVFGFYQFWDTFATAKQFAYADEYDSRQAPNRRIKRLIEADN